MATLVLPPVDSEIADAFTPSGVIHLWARELRSRIQGGTIGGVAVDMQNCDHLLAAAYSLGLMDGQKGIISDEHITGR